MEKGQLAGIFVRICMVLAVMCIVCLFLVDPKTPEQVITIVTLAINISIIVSYYVIKKVRRKSKDENEN